MKLTIELETSSPTAVADMHQLAKLLDQWERPEVAVTLTTVDEAPVEAPKKKRTRKKAAPKVEELAPAPVAEELPLTEEPDGPTKADVSAAVTELIRVKGRPAAREVLTTLDAIDDKGLPRISCIDESRYSEAMALITEQL